jgi:hypothetical protein
LVFIAWMLEYNEDALIVKDALQSFMGQGITYLSVVALVQGMKDRINAYKLSTHERHAHLAIRNEKRKNAIPANSRNWTEEEVNLLKEVCRNYRYTNIEISKILTTKTAEQIKNKKEKLKMISEEASSQEFNQET